MSDKLPPLPEPDVPEGDWLVRDSYIKQYAVAYGQQCYQQALEDAARMLMAEHERRWHNDNHALFFAHKVRALGTKGIVMSYTTTPRNVLPNGLTLLQQNPDCAAKLDPTAKDHGWLYTRRAETDWRWVTLRKLSDAEIETAYDQAADMAVLHGTKVRAG